MDPERDLQYSLELRKQVEEDIKTREMVVSLESKVENLRNSPIPQNVREQYDIDIQKWREEDKFYYETHSFPSVMQKIRDQPYVTFVGVPGSGKSATAHHIALKLQEEGYEVVPTKDVRKMEDYGDPRNPQVFVVDDVVGVFGLHKTNLNVLTNYEQKITQPCMPKSRTLMTCRQAVYNESLPYESVLTKEETVVRLHSFDHSLNDKDKKQILQKYGLDANLLSPALLTSASRMFPLLCKLFSKEIRFQELGSNFFINPTQCIIDEFDGMQRHNKLNYATLVLCMLNENRLSKDIIKDRKNEHFMNMKRDALENCKLEFYTDTFQFMDALSAMEGTYTKRCSTQYTFIHDSVFEICAYQYGNQFPDQMLLNMNSSYIANYVKAQTNESANISKVEKRQWDSQSVKGGESSNDSDEKEKQSGSQFMEEDESSNDSDEENKSDDKNVIEESFDLCIRLHDAQYPLLAERLYRDIQSMELYDVFRNPALKKPLVCQAFIDVLERKSYTELKSLFLSSQESTENLMSKGKSVLLEDKRKKGAWDECINKWRILMDERVLMDNGKMLLTHDVRVISWVVYFGHHLVLKYMINQIQKHHEIHELFKATENIPHQCESVIYTRDEQGRENNRLVEEFRLLVLSCYSGDVQTVRVLLDMCAKTTIGIGKISEDIQCSWCHHSPLTAACNGGHASVVNELVKIGAEVNLQDRWGNTPLITTCKEGHVSVVVELVKLKAEVNLQDVYGNRPLIAACERGHVSVVKELVNAKTDVNLKNNQGDTPLTAASKGRHLSAVKKLVKAGANVNLQGGRGNTPLVAACERGHVGVVNELIKAGADISQNDEQGIIPLIATCERGYVRVVEKLVKAGADVNQQDERGNTPLITACERKYADVVDELLKAGADINQKDMYGNTPLIAACKVRDVGAVKVLVKAGAYVNLEDNWGNTPLIVACEIGHVPMVEELVKAKPNVNLQSKNAPGHILTIVPCVIGPASMVGESEEVWPGANRQERLGNTALIAACDSGHVSVVKELVKVGADVNQRDVDGNVPLIAAFKGGYVNVVEELLNAGADVNLHDMYENTKLIANTPLIAACDIGHVGVIKALVKAKVNANLQNDNGYTPLIVACMRGYVSVVEELLNAGADVNLHGKWGNTPLITVCERGHVSLLENLVNAGGNVNQEDKRRYTPLIAACVRGHVTLVEELVKIGADIKQYGKWGNTPLVGACKRGHVSVVKELVKEGADVNRRGLSKQYNRPLIPVAACGGELVSLMFNQIELLKSRFIWEQLIVLNELQSVYMNTPIKDACEKGYESMIEELLKVGADVNLQDDVWYTPMTAACEGGQVSVVMELLKAGADVCLEDLWGNTPLIVACKNGHVSVMAELWKAGADINQKGRKQNTPLTAACERGHADAVEELVKAGADINPKYGKTPLILACEEANVSLMKKLLKLGADVNQENRQGYTPLIAACERGHVDAVGELLMVGADINPKYGKTPLILAC